MTQEEIIEKISNDDVLPYIEPWALKEIVEFVIQNSKPTFSSNLDEAAEEYYDEMWDELGGVAMVRNNEHDIWYPSSVIETVFKAGAGWLAKQGYTKETQVYVNRWTDVDEVAVSLGQRGEYGFKAGDKVIVQIRKK